MPHPELLYPHEDVIGLVAGTVACGETVQIGQLARMALPRLASKTGEWPSVHSSLPFELGMREEFAVMNGHRHGAELLYKGEFPHIILGLGYLAPRTTVVRPGAGTDETLAAIAELDENPARFLKPLCGSSAKGTMRAENPEQALTFAREQGRPYLAQTVETTAYEIRHALHRDPTQVQEDAPPGWRLAFRKIRPSVEGDGRTPLRQLVEQNPNMTKSALAKYRKHGGMDDDWVPAEGEHVEMAVGGNIGARLLGDQELRNIDTFMTEMTTKLEEHIGHSLATSCFDIGVKHEDTLSGPYDRERLLQELVFYEFQVPFGFVSYILALPPPQQRVLRALSSAGQVGFGAATLFAFSNSMLASGKVARKKYKASMG